jgi:two-component system NtrC family sensor kinase
MLPHRYPLKAKLTIATLIPLFVAIIICWFTGVFILTAKVAGQAQDKVRNDLNSAREIYNHELGHIRDVVKFTAAAPYTADAFSRQNGRLLGGILTPLFQNEHLDVFTAVDASGKVLFRSRNPLGSGDDRSQDPLVRRALAGESVSGTVVLPATQIALEGEDLARRSIVKAVATPYANRSTAAENGAGMMLMSSAPVRDRAGNVVGVLYGGVLLNNNNNLVDKIKNTVYEGVTYKGEIAGNSTIFLGDLRIATNVPGRGTSRAIGTKLSEEVYNRVVLKDEKWIGRAFVVNDWYFSAYEPILSPEGVPVGALYVGMLEKPYTSLKFNLGLWFSALLMLGSLIGFAVANLVSARLARPVKELETLARRVAAGERGVTIDVTSDDEIGDLADEFNRMSVALTRQEQEIWDLNRGLENKVRERTQELEENNRLLVTTQQELVRVEKLAAIGELAAGVAHEINNPLAIIRGNNELLQLTLPEDAPCQEEIGIIGQQVGRVERIVANLLRFARMERKHLGLAPVNRILDEILRQVGHQIPLTAIAVKKDYDPADPAVEGDADQLRQVFTNLILNGLQAMPGGGTLAVSTRLVDGICRITVADTGGGISPENLEQIFNPFFTTRPNGTGLGLAVSYGIVKDHGGDIAVESSAAGTKFMVTLHVHIPAHLKTADPSASD